MTDLFARSSRRRTLLTLFWIANAAFALGLAGFALR
jgi:hypothetical protein